VESKSCPVRLDWMSSWPQLFFATAIVETLLALAAEWRSTRHVVIRAVSVGPLMLCYSITGLS